jgi:hypothetical protein
MPGTLQRAAGMAANVSRPADNQNDHANSFLGR